MMSEWQPIETYDKLKFNERPKHAVFWIEGTAPVRGQVGNYGLPPGVVLSRHYGSRVCTHWMPLPKAPE